MYKNYNICNFEYVLRNNIFNFIRRLESCTNSIIQFLIQSWYMKFENLKRWVQILLTCFLSNTYTFFIEHLYIITPFIM